MSITSTPYLVDFVQTGTGVTFCQGSFITPYVILTAAQCLVKVDLDDITLSWGSVNWELKAIEHVAVPHELYRQRVHRHDIGLLFLPSVPPYPLIVDMVQSRREAPGLTTAYGWGLLQYGVESEVLGMPRRHRNSINQTQPRRILDELRCSPINAEEFICKGYPGGPVLCGEREQKLCGLNMFEYGNVGGKQNPAVYTELMFYRNWIQQKLDCACRNSDCKNAKHYLQICTGSTADSKLMTVLKYTFDVGYITGSPDGVRVSHILGINGKFPGPTIHALPGDIVEVTVNNRIADNQTTTIHWHGITQATTPFEDGPAYVSQCPIISGSSQVYRFPVQHTGTYWYHSHVGSQYTEGLWGLLIVHNLRDEVYFDTEFNIALQEWYHNSAHDNDAWHLSPDSHGAPPFPNSGLMNGVGRFDCRHTNLPCDTREQKYPVFSLRRSEVNKVRLANVGGYATYNVTIEGHRLKVMEVDGIESNNRTVTNGVFLGAGQRYSLLLEQLGDVDKSEYFILANIRTEFMYLPENRANINPKTDGIVKTIVGLIRYVPFSTPLGEPLRVIRNVSGGKNVTEVVPRFEAFPYTMTVPRIPSDTTYLSSSSVKAKKTMAPPPKSDVVHVLDLDFVDMTNGVRRGAFNGVSFIMPPGRKPLLMRMLDDEMFPSTTPFIEVEYGQVVDFVVNNLPRGPHPIHLHGHHFWPVASGSGIYNASRTHKPPKSPIKRDTIVVKEQSYAVIRFVADNPGVWPLHCHIDWHQLSGMRIVVKEAAEVARMLLSVPHKQARLCSENGVNNVHVPPSGNVWQQTTSASTTLTSCASCPTCTSLPPQIIYPTCPSTPTTSTYSSSPGVGSAELPTPRPEFQKVPLRCGGVIDGESNGLLELEAPYTLPQGQTCLWTLRAGNYQNVNITLVKENFLASGSKIRLIPMHSMLWYRYDGSSASLNQKELSAGSEGTTHSFYMPVVFVELVILGNGTSRPKFTLSFLGTGSPEGWNGYAFTHTDLANPLQSITHVNRRTSDYQSFVILPLVPNGGEVIFVLRTLNLQNCNRCACDNLRIWKIGSRSLLLNTDHADRFCGISDNSLHDAHDDVGFIIVYFSADNPSGDFSFAYHTNPPDE